MAKADFATRACAPSSCNSFAIQRPSRRLLPDNAPEPFTSRSVSARLPVGSWLRARTCQLSDRVFYWVAAAFLLGWAAMLRACEDPAWSASCAGLAIACARQSSGTEVPQDDALDRTQTKTSADACAISDISERIVLAHLSKSG